MEIDYKTIFKKLNESEIDYLIIGGLAVNFYGIPRMTYDIDIMIYMELNNISKFINIISKLGYKPKVPVNPIELSDKSKREVWIREKGMKVFNFYNPELPIGEIDIFIDSPVSYEELKERCVKIRIEEIEIPVISINDLIKLKLHSGRKQDLSDVEYLNMIKEK